MVGVVRFSGGVVWLMWCGCCSVVDVMWLVWCGVKSGGNGYGKMKMVEFSERW